MEYIHKQIQEFIEGMSQRMILRQIYFAIPQVDNGLLPKEVDTIFTVRTNNDGHDALRQFSGVIPRYLKIS